MPADQRLADLRRRRIRELEVEQDDIRAVFGCGRDRVRPGACFGDDLDVVA
jgi:hypothetical protein